MSKIATGVLTNLPAEEWPGLVARHRIDILAELFPGAVLGHRTAFDGGVPTPDGAVFLSYRYRRVVVLPGLTVHLSKGPGPLEGDSPMHRRNLHLPSEARTLLENLSFDRGSAGKSAGRGAVEQRLITICDARGEAHLRALREHADRVAEALGLGKELVVLGDTIGGILGTREARMATAKGRGRAASVAFDSDRLVLFETLAAYLRKTPLKQPASVTPTPISRSHFAFLESYFSNFIEGTEFEIQEARAFVLDGKIIEARPKDSHDIVGVYRQIMNPGWALQTLASGAPVLGQLRARHADQMSERPEVAPGEFKLAANQVGNTLFVAPRLVRGTLVEGSRLLSTVPEGSARALMAMFLVSEVHPFADGNGRLSRLCMNAELSSVGACRIIIPTLYREQYLDCLRVLSCEGNPKPFVDAMQHIQTWTAGFHYENLDDVIRAMKVCNAFEKSLAQHKLLMPLPRPAKKGKPFA